MEKVKVGVVGCGTISKIYLKNMCDVFEVLDVVACADLVAERAGEVAAAGKGIRALSVDGLFADPEVELVLNLTVPKAHAEVSLGAVEAGKHVYAEKPITVMREECRTLLELAAAKNLLVGNAPDTFLGGGIQTCRKLIDDGAIGEPVAATAFMLSHGPESWHPNPGFYYEQGGGPMFDMAPYYLTALINLLGPISRVTGSTAISFPERVATCEAKKGLVIQVETPTHVVGLLDFANGAIGTIITSFDVWAHSLPRIEIYGSEGSLQVPDPNTFGGPVRIRKPGDAEWADVELTHGCAENGRGIGVADMACAAISGRAHRASGKLAYHVLDIMHSIHDASDQGRHVELESGCEQPAALPLGLKHGELDA